jgi:hypothetical protein
MSSPLSLAHSSVLKALGAALQTSASSSGISRHAIDDCGNGRIPLPKPPKFDASVVSKALEAARVRTPPSLASASLSIFNGIAACKNNSQRTAGF